MTSGLKEFFVGSLQLGLWVRSSFDSSSAMAGWIVFGALVVGVALLRRCGAIVVLARRSPSWNWRGWEQLSIAAQAQPVIGLVWVSTN